VKIIPGYIRKKFVFIFLFLLISIIIMFLIIDLVENLDKFIDKKVTTNIIIEYYLYYIPYIIVLIMPMVTLMATVFCISSFAKHNEIIAFKALGMSMAQIMRTIIFMGIIISAGTFVIAEKLAIPANRKMFHIKEKYLENRYNQKTGTVRNIQLQEPPDKIVTIGYFDAENSLAKNVTVETFKGNKIISRLDSPVMIWDGKEWTVKKGVQRIFDNENEILTKIKEPIKFHFNFTPKQIALSSLKPDEMNFSELVRFIKRIRNSGGETYELLTDLHFRISFPFSNLVIVFFSIPLVYNRRQKSIAAGFGISLIVSFFYFGLVKTGQTMGHKGTANPVLAAWLGNLLMIASAVVFNIKARK